MKIKQKFLYKNSSSNKIKLVLEPWAEEFEVKIYIDQSSIEIFLDKGLYAMTSQLFPSEEYSKMTIKNNSKSNLEIKNQTIKSLKSIWK